LHVLFQSENVFELRGITMMFYHPTNYTRDAKMYEKPAAAAAASFKLCVVRFGLSAKNTLA